jgi:hypothetical protein
MSDQIKEHFPSFEDLITIGDRVCCYFKKTSDARDYYDRLRLILSEEEAEDCHAGSGTVGDKELFMVTTKTDNLAKLSQLFDKEEEAFEEKFGVDE